MLYTTYYTSPLGRIRIQCSDEQVKAVLFVSDESFTTHEHPLLNQCLVQLDEFFAGKRREFDLPVQQGLMRQQRAP